MNFDEKFLDRNVAELCETYDKIHGYNINAARITPELIDGLKPVQRRALYIMYLKDQGKNFRKLATIAGDTFGRIHPHCLHGDTEVIFTNGSKHKLKDLRSDEVYEVMSYNNSNGIARTLMHDVRITKYVSELYEVKFTNGYSIRCTNDHNLLVMRHTNRKTKYKEEIKDPAWIAAENIHVGDIMYSGEFSNLSFNNEDVGYPTVYLPQASMIYNDGGKRFVLHRYFTNDKRLNTKSSPFEFQIHHDDLNKNNFSKRNLKVLENSEHQKFHVENDNERMKICLNALDEGRLYIKTNPILVQKMKERNSHAMKQVNKVLPIFKAFKIVSAIITDRNEVNKCNYDEYRKNVYNSSSIESLYEKGLIKSPTIESLLYAYNNRKKNDYVKFDNLVYSDKAQNLNDINDIDGRRIGSLISSFRKVYSRNIMAGVEIVKENFITGLHKTSHTNIWERCEDAGIDVMQLIDDLKSSFVQVKSVNIIKLDESIPMYDFTVDGYENTLIYNGSRTNSDHSFIIAHNSPVAIEDALVGLEQEWRNSIPLVEGEGNFGSVAGDPAGASRYIKAKLSKYGYACFFEDWKESVVDMIMGYDEETKEPLYLPAKYPNVLLNGCLGIGYGLSTNLPCYSFREVVEACITLMIDPNAHIVLIPDSPTGADIIESDFSKLSERGSGVYTMRCTYEIDDKDNIITITSLPYQINVNTIRERIADIKEHGGLAELVNMNDMSGKAVDLQLVIRDDVNPYKFMKKLIKEVGGLEKTYPVNITITNDYQTFDYSIKQLLLEWIKYRREQKRIVYSHKRTTLLAEQRTNDVKIFLMDKHHLEDTIKIFRSSRNRAEIEQRLIEKYRHSEIRMDSLQARVLSNLRMHELSIDAYEACLKRRTELEEELADVEKTLNEKNGIDKVIIAELRDGIKRFGTPRKSNVIPYKISVHSEIEGSCILQLSSDGNILRKECSNMEEAIPTDTNGFAVKVDNDASFVVVDDLGFYSFVKVKEIPVNAEVPLNRFLKKNLDGNIVAMLPIDIDSDLCCTLISKKGMLKKIRIADMGPSKKPCIALDKDDRLVRGLVTKARSAKDILVYTDNGLGARLDPNNLRITSPSAKGLPKFILKKDDYIAGCYTINESAEYLLYVTQRGKLRLNDASYLPTRESKKDGMLRLINLSDRDHLISVASVNRLDKVNLYFADGDTETINVKKLKVSTMSEDPKKVIKKSITSSASFVVKTKVL